MARNGFDVSGMLARLDRLEQATPRGLRAAAGRTTAVATGHMKATAPWHDRTGAARSGLTALNTSQGDSIEIVLAHSVRYGIWLEVIEHGQWAVVTPSIPWTGNEYMRFISGMWGYL